MPTRATSSGCPPPCSSRPSSSPIRPSHWRRSARRSWRTTSTTPASSSPPMRRPSRTGSGCVASNGSETAAAGAQHAGAAQGDADAAGAVPAASAPLIGVTTYLEQARTGVWDVRAAFLPKAYLDAVTDAGGIAVLLPPQPGSPEIARRVLGALDG